MSIPMLQEVFAEYVKGILALEKEPIVSFSVNTPSSEVEDTQSPILKLLDIKHTKDNKYLLIGYNLNRLPKEYSKEGVNSNTLVRSYRLDRIQPSSFRILN